jgi:hypothetical protein|tara:strand:+ start:116 stop:376 length:261 start_codon:yes stop_codon:yes gene_type:complete
MYITLSLTPDRDGFQGTIALNTEKIIGFKEAAYKDIGGNSQKDKAGYVGTYTEVLMEGLKFPCSINVSDPVQSILRNYGNNLDETK